MTLDSDSLYDPLPDEAYDELVASIREHGQLEPIVRDARTGLVLSGRNRERACWQLGVPPTYRDVTLETDAEALGLVLMANRDRPMAKGKRDVVIAELRAAGWSNRRIAGVLGVGTRTVDRTSTAPNDAVEITGKDGRRQLPKATPEQVAYRRSIVRTYIEAGYKTENIRRALDLGSSVMHGDQRALGLPLRGRKREELRDDMPPAVDWRALAPLPKLRARQTPPPPPPKREPPPKYKTSRAVFDAEAFHQAWAEDQTVSAFAWHVISALRADDHEWISNAERVMTLFADRAAQLVKVLRDRNFRETMAYSEGSPGWEHRPPTLRSVPDLPS